MMRKTILTFLLAISVITVLPAANPKREFRGAWIQAVNHQFEGIPASQLKSTLSAGLDSLEAAGINTVLFQVRVEADALYKSSMEPWSAYLTGAQGQSPDEDWDPLQFMIDECHKRDMELHAWINPFRAKTASTQKLAANHQATVHPERMVKYGDLLLFNPGIKENRDYICKVAANIITRYDVDGFHIDDYFYPYPQDGLSFDDGKAYANDRRGFRNIDDWRRDNINLFIEQLRNTIRDLKPWVKFGVSPFGIYRNCTAKFPEGSATSGLEGYNSLYADVLYWMEKGWVDYCIPQVYWNKGFSAADYSILTEWWAKHSAGCLVYIGQDVQRTVDGQDPSNPNRNQQRLKLNLERSLDNLSGNCFWPAQTIIDNIGGYSTVLKQEYHSTTALQPIVKRIKAKDPEKVRKLMAVETVNGPVLFWTAPKAKKIKDYETACRYVVYRFDEGEKIDVDDASHIVAITRDNYYEFPKSDAAGGSKAVYAVTALNRLDGESAPVKFKVK